MNLFHFDHFKYSINEKKLGILVSDLKYKLGARLQAIHSFDGMRGKKRGSYCISHE